jgi:hypothetical protein
MCGSTTSVYYRSVRSGATPGSPDASLQDVSSVQQGCCLRQSACFRFRDTARSQSRLTLPWVGHDDTTIVLRGMELRPPALVSILILCRNREAF